MASYWGHRIVDPGLSRSTAEPESMREKNGHHRVGSRIAVRGVSDGDRAGPA